MTTGQMICLIGVAAIVIIYIVGQVTKPKVNDDAVLKAMTTATIMAQKEQRFLSIDVSEANVHIFVGSRCEEPTIQIKNRTEG